MTTAFVLSGGGSLGAVQVGMMRMLADRGMRPDLLVGASAGALNAAFVAGRGFDSDTLDDLAHTWTGLRRHDVFPFAPTTTCWRWPAHGRRCVRRTGSGA